MTSPETAAFTTPEQDVDTDYLDIIVGQLTELAAQNIGTLEASILFEYIGQFEYYDQEYVINQLAKSGIEFEADIPDELIIAPPDNPDTYQGLEARNALSSINGVNAYTSRTKTVKLLSGEQEKQLGRRVRAGYAAGRLLHKYRAGEEILEEDLEAVAGHRPILPKMLSTQNLEQSVLGGRAARDQLVQANLRLAMSIARKYTSNRQPYLDLVQEGTLGLIKAAEKFNPDQEAKFATYATWWIKNHILRAVAEKDRTIRIPVHWVMKVFEVYRIENKLTRELGRQPTTEEIAAAVSMDKDEMAALLQAASNPLSLDASINEQDESVFGDTVPDPSSPDPLEKALAADHRRTIAKVLRCLPDRERLIMEQRFGLGDDEPLTLEEIGKIFGVTKERIRQIEKKTLDKLEVLEEAQSLRPVQIAANELD